MDSRIEATLGFIRSKSGRTNVRTLAALVNLSVSRFSHLFSEEVHSSPAQYIASIRLEAAKTLFESTFLSVKEVMGKVGYANESHFVRKFKNAFGVTPGHHRKRRVRHRVRSTAPQ